MVMNKIDEEKRSVLLDEKYDKESMQKHVMPRQFSDGKWYCYRGLFGWSKGTDTKDECQELWIDYCKNLDMLNNN